MRAGGAKTSAAAAATPQAEPGCAAAVPPRHVPRGNRRPQKTAGTLKTTRQTRLRPTSKSPEARRARTRVGRPHDGNASRADGVAIASSSLHGDQVPWSHPVITSSPRPRTSLLNLQVRSRIGRNADLRRANTSENNSRVMKDSDSRTRRAEGPSRGVVAQIGTTARPHEDVSSDRRRQVYNTPTTRWRQQNGRLDCVGRLPTAVHHESTGRARARSSDNRPAREEGRHLSLVLEQDRGRPAAWTGVPARRRRKRSTPSAMRAPFQQRPALQP